MRNICVLVAGLMSFYNRQNVKFLYFTLSLLTCLTGFAQIPGIANYDLEHGLTSSLTYRLSQDRNGFIWLGSDNGLFRFDGSNFIQYNEKDGLHNIEILSAEPLSNGEIFIFPFLNDFAYLKNGKVINADVNRQLEKIKVGSYTPTCKYDQASNTLYIYNSSHPQFMYTYKEGIVDALPLHIADNDYSSIDFQVVSKNLYFQSGHTLNAYNIKTGKRIQCNIEIEKDEVIIRVKDGIYLSKKNNMLSVYHTDDGFNFTKIKTCQLPGELYYCVIDKNHRLWVTMKNGGVYYYQNALTDASPFPQPVKFLGNEFINDIFIDRDDNAWFSSRDHGLFFLSKKFFRNYVTFPIEHNAASITAISANGKDIFLGYNVSKGGIYNAKGMSEFVFDPNKKIEHKAIFANQRMAIFLQAIEAFKLDLSTGAITKILNASDANKNILPFDRDHVLVSKYTGLYKYGLTDAKSELLFPERVYAALRYTADSLFVGTFSDLYKININSKKRKLFLKGYYITDIRKLSGNLYAGATNSKGIILFNNHKILRSITEADGLRSNHVRKIEVQGDHTLWASSNLGLTRVELLKKGLKINNFTRTDGLPSNRVSGCVVRNDTVYAATSKGLGIFKIRDLLAQEKSIDKKVIINSIDIGGRKYLDTNVPHTAKYTNHEVALDLSFPDYASQGDVAYRYIVEGLQNNWTTSKSSRIVLNALPPGAYTFKVYGIGYNGRQSRQFTSLTFEIHPLFWQTRLFAIALCCAIMFLSIYLYLWLDKTARQRKIKKMLHAQKIAELELQAIKAQINPHFIYNCLNSIQFLLYKEDLRETENYLNVFSRMIRKTLHYSEKTFIPISEETGYLQLYLDMEKLRFNERFDYSISCAEAVDDRWEIPSLLVQPFVENAIKHGIRQLEGRRGLVEVSFDYQKPWLCISIRDNGTGIRESAGESNGNAFGIRLSQRRINTFRQLFDMQIMLEVHDLRDSGGEGTEVQLYIFLNEDKITGLHH